MRKVHVPVLWYEVGHCAVVLAVALPVEMNVEDDEDHADYQTPSHQSQRSSGVRTPCTRTPDTQCRVQ